MLSLRLFGVVSLTSSGQPVVGPAAQRRRLALLAILASASDDGVSREKLIWYLWPDVDSKQGRHFLADSVYALRKALGQESIVAIGDNLRLSCEIVESDVAEFRRALARGDNEAAVALYTGPFLDGFFVSDASEFEPWAEAERAMLARKYAGALELLARRHEAAADPAGAALWWRGAHRSRTRWIAV